MTTGRNMRRSAFTLIDVLVTLAVMSIVLFAIMPLFSGNESVRLVGAANLLTADLQNARMLSVQNPGNPVRVVVSPQGTGWFLAEDADPDSPMALPTGVGGDWVVVFGEGPASTLWGVRLSVKGVNPDDIVAGSLPEARFDAFGRLSPATDVEFQLTAGAEQIVVRVRADTGDAIVE